MKDKRKSLRITEKCVVLTRALRVQGTVRTYKHTDITTSILKEPVKKKKNSILAKKRKILKGTNTGKF